MSESGAPGAISVSGPFIGLVVIALVPARALVIRAGPGDDDENDERPIGDPDDDGDDGDDADDEDDEEDILQCCARQARN